jgi:hypothetical protein
VKLVGVRLRVPTYAILLPKLNYASRLPLGARQRRTHVPLQRLSRLLNKRSRVITRYATAVGAHARVPVIVKAYRFATKTQPGRSFTFFLPLDYALLIDSPALLSGNVTVVGKVIRRVEGRVTEPAARFKEPRYFDAQTPLTFVHAVARLPDEVRFRDLIGIPKGRERELIGKSVTIAPPGMVVIPIAIYQ